MTLDTTHRPATYGWVLTVGIGLAITVVLVSFGFLSHSNYNDENFYNPLIRYYASRPIATTVTDTFVHPISIGPMYFLAHRIWGEVVGAGDVQSRSFGLFLMFSASIVWAAIAAKLYEEIPLPLLLSFWLLPFHAVFAICTLAESFMILFLLLAVYCWILAAERPEKNRQISSAWLFCLSGLFLGLAQNAKQPLLILSLGFLVFGVVRLKNVWSVIGPLIAILIQIPFWIRWGNIFPPGQRLGMMPQFAQLSGLFPDTSIHLLTVCGFLMWPALKCDFTSRKTWLLVITGLSVWLLMSPNLNVANPDRLRFAGPLLQLGYSHALVRWAYVVPFLVGWLILWDSMDHVRKNDVSLARQALMLSSVISIIGFVRSPLGFDRYVTCFLPLWWMAYWPQMRDSKERLGISLIVMAILTGILFVRVWHQPEMFPSPVAYLAQLP